MNNKRPESDTSNEREEIQRALSELDTWLAERRNSFMSLQKFIQLGLQSGRLTECRKREIAKKHLTPRMIATLWVNENQLIRAMLLLKLRKKQLEKRLAELDEPQHPSDAA